ncbi:MAG: DUF2062 domain-containing protein [Zoogloeaceae bacterium]|nr:DUF2062 domain-containing protein [Zoogloeaceae bacterium]
MRKIFRRLLPSHETIHTNRWLRPFSNTLLHPRLWHLNRHSVAGAISIGLFCGLIPGPLQMFTAALACMVLRANLPLALVTTLYTNPLTIVPIYFAAYFIGVFVTGGSMEGFVDPPTMGDAGFMEWATAFLGWTLGLGKPLAIGLLALACVLAVAGYFVTRGIYRWWLIRAWHRRSEKRRAQS